MVSPDLHPKSTAPASLLLVMSGVFKSFGRQRVLRDVDFDLRAGEVHVLAGENGAGKSTLIKILGGVHHPDGGRIRLNGRERRFRTPREAAAAGVAIIHQELSLVPSMSVADNVFLGRERSTRGWMHYADQNRHTRQVLDRLGLDIDVQRPVGAFPISVQQLIEIGKALGYNARVIVMDEPTSALNEPEVERLFETVADLKNRGCGIIYITHKLEEVYRIADRITVLRDGVRIATATAREMPAARLIHNMVGRDLVETGASAASTPHADRPVRLAVCGITVPAGGRGHRPRVQNVSFAVRAGEIVGLAGLQGSGNSDLLWGLFGALGRGVTGQFEINGTVYRPRSPRHAIRNGIALLTNDRQRTGLVPSMSVMANATLAAVHRVSPGGWVRGGREATLAAESTQSLRLRAASLQQPVATLSGGNQQKVAMAKWLNTEPQVLLLDEPTRGVDVGAKEDIYQLMDQWREAGLAIVLITSEMPELLRMSDRIIVMHRGRTTAELARTEATQERILRAAMGGEANDD